MNTKWIVALACGAALALGACSGGNAPAPATPTEPGTGGEPGTGNGNGGTGDGDGNGDADGKTPEQRTFDTKLQEAQTALTMAQQQVMAAEDAARGATTDAERTAAQTLIANARTALTAAVTAARALEALVPDGEAYRRGQAVDQVRRATAAQTSETAKLDAAGESVVITTGWAARSVLSRTAITPPVTITVDATRTLRRNADATADARTRLEVGDFPAVMYEAGKIVIRDGADSSGDRLRMRGYPLIWAQTGTGGVSTNTGSQEITATVGQEYFDLFFGGLKITSTGLAIDLGGGAYPGPDMSLLPTTEDGDINSADDQAYDLALVFGTPSASSTGNSEHYWAAALTASDVQLENAALKTALTDSNNQVRPLGTYHLRMSNHLGGDKRLENPNDPVKSAEDDRNFYLSYASYGLFDYVSAGYVPNTGYARWSRIFPFAVGYDAFKDADDMKVTDVADADEIINGRFTGRTIAEELKFVGTTGYFGTPNAPIAANRGLMLRGDIALTATISGTEASNSVGGTISNLQSWDGTNEYWRAYAHFTSVTLQSGSIGDDGSFSGVVTDPDGATVNFRSGFYKGSFYGPLSELETAGTWFVPSGPVATSATDTVIVGSFGAALVQGDGTYGHTVVGPPGGGS